MLLTIVTTVGSIETSLDEVLPFGLGDKRLKLGRSKCIHMSCLRSDKEEHLGPRQGGQLVGLLHDTSLSLAEGNMAPALIFNVFDTNLATTCALL